MDLIALAKSCGFDEAFPMDATKLKAEQWVRDSCASDKCKAYGHNWTCPPECGTLEECAERMGKYKNGILLQSVGHMEKTIDVKAYVETEERHKAAMQSFAEKIKESYPDCLPLGSGGCRICRKCAYPEPCKFPEKALSSMEAYGLFVTQVCKDNNVAYNYGPKTISYTACVLFNED